MRYLIRKITETVFGSESDSEDKGRRNESQRHRQSPLPTQGTGKQGTGKEQILMSKLKKNISEIKDTLNILKRRNLTMENWLSIIDMLIDLLILALGLAVGTLYSDKIKEMIKKSLNRVRVKFPDLFDDGNDIKTQKSPSQASQTVQKPDIKIPKKPSVEVPKKPSVAVQPKTPVPPTKVEPDFLLMLVLPVMALDESYQVGKPIDVNGTTQLVNEVIYFGCFRINDVSKPTFSTIAYQPNNDVMQTAAKLYVSLKTTHGEDLVKAKTTFRLKKALKSKAFTVHEIAFMTNLDGVEKLHRIAG